MVKPLSRDHGLMNLCCEDADMLDNNFNPPTLLAELHQIQGLGHYQMFSRLLVVKVHARPCWQDQCCWARDESGRRTRITVYLKTDMGGCEECFLCPGDRYWEGLQYDHVVTRVWLDEGRMAAIAEDHLCLRSRH